MQYKKIKIIEDTSEASVLEVRLEDLEKPCENQIYNVRGGGNLKGILWMIVS